MAEPLSKLACYEYWMAERAYLPEAAALTLDHLYFALDFLDTHIEAIERAIEHEEDLETEQELAEPSRSSA